MDKIIDEIKEKERIFDCNKAIINISGGYKAIIPYMTIFAQLYGIQSVYIYEDSSSLITIPSLPIQIDWAFAEEYYPYLSDPKLNKDKDKLNYLQQKGLLIYDNDKNGKGSHSWTSLGSFFKNVIEKELHVSKSVMGFFFEYKLYEYYVENIYQDKYNIVKHSELIHKDKNPYKDVEIDLILSTKYDTDYIAIEVKPITNINKADMFKKLKKIEKHINTMKEYIDMPRSTLMCITPDKRVFSELYDSQIESIKELRELFKGHR